MLKEKYPAIVDDGGGPRLDHTRIKVKQVAEYHEKLGWDAKDIAHAFRLSLSQVHMALAYYYDHKAEIDAVIEEASRKIRQLPAVEDVLQELLDNTLTAQEVANEFSISVDAVYQAVRRGRLRARKSGKTLLILRQDAAKLWADKQE